MRVMVAGATGLIGSTITARLISAGHNVSGLARDVKDAARHSPAAQWKACDIARMREPGLWMPYLEGVDAVVNCAGVLQDGPGDSTRGVHADGVAARDGADVDQAELARLGKAEGSASAARFADRRHHADVPRHSTLRVSIDCVRAHRRSLA